MIRPASTVARPLPTRFDPFCQDDALRRPYQLLHAGAWDELEAELAGDPAGWPVLSLLAGEDAAVEVVVLQRYAEARPSARSVALFGGAVVRDAFALHRANPGAFASLLHQAEEILHHARRLDPDLADPWVHLLATGRGLRVELRELRDRFENAHARVPFRADACIQYLHGLSSRSGGSDGAMFDFARWIQSEAPPGSPAMVTLPTAHLEYGMGEESPRSLTEHLSHPATVAELTPALADFMWESPTRATHAELPTLNAFALAMTVEERESANLVRECFRRIDNRPTAYPWTLYQDEEIAEVFTEVQRSQLRSAERFGP